MLISFAGSYVKYFLYYFLFKSPLAEYNQRIGRNSCGTRVSSHIRNNQRGLHFIHINVRSLLPKITELRNLALKTKAAVISITETWLDSTVTDNEINRNGYCIERNDRNRNGGGVCSYIRNDIAFLPRHDLQSNDLEATWLEILLPKTKPIMVGTVYRPPKQTNFFNHFENVFLKIRSDIEVIILGDFNVCFKDRASSIYKKYVDVINLFNMKQLINTPGHSYHNVLCYHYRSYSL